MGVVSVARVALRPKYHYLGLTALHRRDGG